MNREIRSFADDTTGALDVAGSFHARGFRTTVHLEEDTNGQHSAPSRVVNLNSRYDSAEQSVAKLIRGLEGVNTYQQTIFLKVDSTLRGNIYQDVEALGEVFPNSQIFIAPALPFYGRTCIDGVYQVKGEPIVDTEFARDRAYKLSSSLLHDNRKDTQHINWRTLDRGVEAVLAKIGSSQKKQFTFDTRDQSDLEVIADAALDAEAILVGSSGLARAFPKQRTSLPEFTIDSSLPALFVIGSIHPNSRVQKEELSRIGVNGLELHRRDIGNEAALGRIHDRVAEKLDEGETVYIATPDEVTNDAALWRDIEQSIELASGISVVNHNLIVVGGETARATLRGRGVKTLTIQDEYEAGVPISSEPDRSEAIFTKAGGFGHPNTLVDIYRYLQ